MRRFGSRLPKRHSASCMSGKRPPFLWSAPTMCAQCRSTGERGILYAVEDATIACTYMMLATHARGLHSCWTGAFDEDEVREVLGLPPHIRPLAILATGHGHPPGHLAERMDTGEHVHRDVW